MKGKMRAASYLGQDSTDWMRPVPASYIATKPDLCALVESAEGGGKVIWLSDGFPVDRSRYGRIALERVTTGKV